MPVAIRPTPTTPLPPTPRLQIPENVAPVAIPTPEELGLQIPTPEELGLGATERPTPTTLPTGLVTPETPIDWTMVERELDRRGATGYQMEKQTTGFRFTITLPTGIIAGRGASKGEAVRHAMQQLTK